ncbi:uncharacterized protein LY89DRAFT_786592 [Mollisia scopiformis]|uniref:Uncharacterized protein n=1 Tax=Mollisia scopiformis TaxID=149040 RepID=A0A194WVV4_MOLSC|nr:uncharacterized protein LY89DRAFT_786592 [Mollisia scopiformis]KUJ11717.1 hypothetical protein LY89DRAFT_786592 [Mollisia scopiformis]
MSKMYFQIPIILWGLSRLVSGVAFINPPDGATQQAQDYSSNAAHKVGSSLKIEWSLQSAEQDKPLTLVMWEDVANTYPEYISQDIAANTTTFDWTVATNKTFSTTQAFFFDLYFSPATISSGVNNEVAISHYFNITTSASSTSSSTSSTSTPTSTSTPSSSSSSSSSSSLSTGAKIGIGAGIGVVAIAALAVAFLIFRHRRQKKNANLGIATDAFPAAEKAPPGYKEHHDEETGFVVPGGVSELAGGGYKPVGVAPEGGASELDGEANAGLDRREGIEGRYEMGG